MVADPTESQALTLSQVETGGDSALLGITFSVQQGEVLGLIGPDGAQVLAAIAGFARVRAGEVMIDGHLALETPPHRRRIGMVSRNRDVFSHLSVADNIRLSPQAEPRLANSLLDGLDLRAIAKRRPVGLPAEVMLRIALARALAQRPRLLLLEDPMAELGSDDADWLKSWLRGWAREQGVAVVVASDAAHSFYGLADRVAALHGGRLHQIGTAQELHDQPKSLFVAQAMGETNLLRGQVTALDHGIATLRLPGGVAVEGIAVDAMRPGMECVLSIRPERLAIADMHPTDIFEGALPAKLRRTVFAGMCTRLSLELVLGAEHRADMIASRPCGAALPRNGSVGVAWQPAHASVFSVDLC